MMNTKLNNVLLHKKDSEEERRKQYIEEMVVWLMPYDWTYFITLNFHDNVSEVRARHALTKFISKLNENVFGSRSKKSIRIVPVIEKHFLGSYHVHLLLEDPVTRIANIDKRESLDLKSTVRECWESISPCAANIRKSCPDDESWFQLIDNKEATIRYVVKEAKKGRSDVVQTDMINLYGKKANQEIAKSMMY